MESMPYVDFLFGNETEAATFAECEGWDTKDLAEIALRVSRMPKASAPAPCRHATPEETRTRGTAPPSPPPTQPAHKHKPS
jgi:sugar/nucleoside kinase (ribokinase family)